MTEGQSSTIAQYLEGKGNAVLFSELVKGLGMPVVAVWLGVLLGGFRVEQVGGFYGDMVRVAGNWGGDVEVEGGGGAAVGVLGENSIDDELYQRSQPCFENHLDLIGHTSNIRTA